MSRTALILTIILAGIVPIWGCNSSSSGVVNSSLEARIIKLEKEFKAVEAARDAAEARAKDMETRWKAEVSRVTNLLKERDEAQANLKNRTSEKDEAMAKLDNLKKGLQNLMQSMENTPTTTTSTLPAPTPVMVPVSTTSKVPTVVLPLGNPVRIQP
jgi:seryl-tRNA synthetase